MNKKFLVSSIGLLVLAIGITSCSPPSQPDDSVMQKENNQDSIINVETKKSDGSSSVQVEINTDELKSAVNEMKDKAKEAGKEIEKGIKDTAKSLDEIEDIKVNVDVKKK